MKGWPLAWRRALLRCQLFWRRLPAAVPVVAAALLAVLLLDGLLVPAVRGRAERAEAALARARQHPAVPQDARQAPPQLSDWQRFRDLLGDARHGEQQVATLFAIAQDLQLALLQGQYRLGCEDEAPFCRLRMQLPVQGRDLVIRRFIDEALRAIPFAALDQLSFKRESAADEDVGAELVFTLYMAPRPAAAGMGGPP